MTDRTVLVLWGIETESVMQINISVQFVFNLPLTENHVAALIQLSQHHYDGRCKLASSENGFLIGWRRLIENEVSLIRANFEELDTCLKLLEHPYSRAPGLLSREDDSLCDEMSAAFHGALRLANSKYGDWQAVYDTTGLRRGRI